LLEFLGLFCYAERSSVLRNGSIHWSLGLPAMPWKRGQSGNPLGRLSEKPFRDALRMVIAAAGTDLKKLRRIAEALVEKAESGDLQAIKEVADRLDGKPALSAEITTDHTLRFVVETLPELDREEWEKKYLPAPTDQ
jgi:hypothetical protein